MSGINQELKAIAGVFSGIPLVSASAALGTTPVLIPLCTSAIGQIRKIKISNISASNAIAYQITKVGAAAPVFIATTGATSGVILIAGKDEYICLPANVSLYLVGSAAASSYCVSSYTL